MSKIFYDVIRHCPKPHLALVQDYLGGKKLVKETCRDNEPYACRHGFNIHAILYSNAQKLPEKTYCEERINKISGYKSNESVKNTKKMYLSFSMGGAASKFYTV